MDNMLIIVVKEIVQSVRDIKTFTLIIFMPTILTFILGVSFTDNLNNSINLENVNVFYKLDCSEDEKTAFENFIKITDNLGANTYDDVSMKDKCEIQVIVHSFREIDILYKNGFDKETKIIKGLLMSFLDRGISFQIINSLGCVASDEINSNNIDYFPINSKGATKSLDYYGITMVTLTTMFFSISSAYKIITDKQNRTLNRIMYSGISKYSVAIGKLIGSIMIVFLQLIVVVYISSAFLKVNWGNKIYLIMLILISLGFVSVSLGNMLGTLFNDNRTIWILLLSFIMILGFLSGSYIPIEYLNISFIDKINIINPLALTNKTIFSVIYAANIELFCNCMIVNALYTVIFTGVSLKCKF